MATFVTVRPGGLILLPESHQGRDHPHAEPAPVEFIADEVRTPKIEAHPWVRHSFTTADEPLAAWLRGHPCHDMKYVEIFA